MQTLGSSEQCYIASNYSVWADELERKARLFRRETGALYLCIQGKGLERCAAHNYNYFRHNHSLAINMYNMRGPVVMYGCVPSVGVLGQVTATHIIALLLFLYTDGPAPRPGPSHTDVSAVDIVTLMICILYIQFKTPPYYGSCFFDHGSTLSLSIMCVLTV